MLPLLFCLLAVEYDVHGRLLPAASAAITLHGAVTPFQAETLAGPDGRFRFRNVPAGDYTVSAFFPGRGESRLTISVGPSQAGKDGRVVVVLRIDESKLQREPAHAVSMRQLRIPAGARREYDAANAALRRRDIPAAIAHLEKAVAIEPLYSAAWNHLGTLAYQTQRYPDAEAHFRKSLAADPQAYEPLVNLGGVLLNLEKFDEAWQHNLAAVLKRPNDALANSQMGMTYFYLNKIDLAEKYLKEARRLDPGHFSHPQLLLAEISAIKGHYPTAAAHLEDFLLHHPDHPNAPRIREQISHLRR